MFGAFSKSRERSRISESAFQGAYKEFVNQIMMNEKNHEFNMEAMENKSMREILESQWAMANIEYHFVLDGCIPFPTAMIILRLKKKIQAYWLTTT